MQISLHCSCLTLAHTCDNTTSVSFSLRQGLISRTKDFDDAFESIRSKLARLRDQVVAADGLQPDILAKKSQSDQFRVS